MSYPSHPNDVACPTCGVGQGQQCRSLTTNRSTDTHEGRRQMLYRAQREYREAGEGR